jgi:ectoine hydroxylase-related dioxygenase (phytanoyl-CoA dioxygenase family)
MTEAVATEAAVAEFLERGFCVVQAVVDAPELAAMNAAIDEDRKLRPENWELHGPGGSGGWKAHPVPPTRLGDAVDEARRMEIAVGEAGRWQTRENSLLHSSSSFDCALYAPKILAVVEELMAGQLLCRSLDAMWRAPVPEAVPAGDSAHHEMWHREAGGSCDPHAPNMIAMLQVIIYLSDVGPDTHCFSALPESLEEKRALPVRQVDGNRPERSYVVANYDRESAWKTRPGGMPGAVNIHGPAGTAVLLNNLTWHAATVRQSLEARRTCHVVYSTTHHGQAALDATSPIPARLLEHPQHGWLFSANCGRKEWEAANPTVEIGCRRNRL